MILDCIKYTSVKYSLIYTYLSSMLHILYRLFYMAKFNAILANDFSCNCRIL